MHENLIPATKGQVRQTWRGNLRSLLLSLAETYPKADRNNLLSKYLIKVASRSKLKWPMPEDIVEALTYKFDNDWASLERARLEEELEQSNNGSSYKWRRLKKAKPRPITKAEIEAEAANVRQIIWLDYVLPNGKRLRDCTGLECRQQGDLLNGLLGFIARRIGDKAIVGRKLSEADLQNIQTSMEGKRAKGRTVE